MWRQFALLRPAALTTTEQSREILASRIAICEPIVLPILHSTEKELNMVIADRLRALREQKNLSQGDIEKRTGLLRCYISRVENGHTVPAIETLEKMARALEMPLYQLFYDSEEPPKLPNFPKRKNGDDVAWGSSGKDARILGNFRRLLKRASESDRKLLLSMAQKMARPTNRRA
jgi:transcriptional regulator with XRE-family HTH domain